MPDSQTYDSRFYQVTAELSLSSARVIVPIVCNLVRPSSVIDVGCGCGAWLATFSEFGASRILGLDGGYVPGSLLMVPPECFRAVDLRQPVALDERFDLALCIEVAEHLPQSCADGLVSWLTNVAPVVLFSAAVPLQGGTRHVNEQWPQYWTSLFRRFGYTRVDAIRRHILNDGQVQWWYRQNIFLYVSKDRLDSYPGIAEASRETDDLMLVHAEVLRSHLALRNTLRRLPARVARAALMKLAGRSRGTWP